MKVIKWWKLSSGESYQVMKVIKWWKLSSNESFLVMKLIWWWKLYSDESYQMMTVIKWWKLSSHESFQVMKVIKWWKLSNDESYERFLVMKLIWWWKLYSDESYLVMKVKEVEMVLKSDGWWRFACGDVSQKDNIWFVLWFDDRLSQVCCTWSWPRSPARRVCTSSRWTSWGSWPRLPIKLMPGGDEKSDI